ncbi:MAG: TRAP transporter small permease subunit [Roseobacter sp.]
MPGLSFTLPHWLYWVGLIAFPLIAMALARRPKPAERTYSSALGYMILVMGGIIGLHRFYLKSLLGFIYIPIFLFILYSNGQEQLARNVLSDVSNEVRVAERTIQRETPRLEKAINDVEKYTTALADTEEGSFKRKSAQRRLERAQGGIETGQKRLEEAQTALDNIGDRLTDATGTRAFWANAAGVAFYIILALMLIDAVLLPGMVKRANATIKPEQKTDVERALENADIEDGPKDDRDWGQNWIDRLSLFCGEFVAYWAVIAVFVYYYEVIARYVFNSPTNWAHEGMYLMFGMQYLIAGSYAMLTETHVRVDIFYAPLKQKSKAWVDLLTSVFFFIFAGTLLATSYIFAMDAIAVPSGNGIISTWARGEIPTGEMLANFDLAQFTNPAIRWGEISFNEWEVPLWPMKWVMVIGGLLLVLQGLSKISKDVRAIARGE